MLVLILWMWESLLRGRSNLQPEMSGSCALPWREERGAAGSLRREQGGEVSMGRRREGEGLEGGDGDGDLPVLQAYPRLSTVSDSEV